MSSKLEEILINSDLDVQKAISPIPKDDDNGHLYIRVHLGEGMVEPNMCAFVNVRGTTEALIIAIKTLLTNYPQMQEILEEGLKEYSTNKGK